MDKRIKIYAAKANSKCADVPLKTHAHLFRHAKASHWIEDGLSIVEVQLNGEGYGEKMEKRKSYSGRVLRLAEER